MDRPVSWSYCMPVAFARDRWVPLKPNMTQSTYAAKRKNSRLWTCALMLLSSSALVAQSAPTPPPDAATIKRYDKNGNGVLDPAETAAMEADRAALEKATVQPTAAAQPAASDDVVVMSPFEVNSGNDRGYLATNTMSGTRLNSKLEDLGSSISVVTKAQIQDLGLTDLNDIFLYEANTEGTGNYTDFTIDRNGAVNDSTSWDPNNANRVRGIAAANQARGNFATSGRIPIDPINIDAVEISRGPNATIFGLGSASGTVNIVPARASLYRETTTLQFRGDDRGSTRASLDLNRPIIKDTLAIRGSAVYQEDQFKLKPSIARSERYNGMITYQPFKYTTIRGAIEYYESYVRRPNAVLPKDGITYWESIGKPTWDPVTYTVHRNGTSTQVAYINDQTTETARLGLGLESLGSGGLATPTLFVERDGSIPEYTVSRRTVLSSATAIPTPDYQGSQNPRYVLSSPEPRVGPLAQTVKSLSDKRYYDWSSMNILAPNWNQSRTKTFTVELEQFFLNTRRHMLATQLGWNREESDSVTRRVVNNPTVYIDVNENLLDGRVNPFFLRPYINASIPSTNEGSSFRDIFRGQLAYQLNLQQERNWKHWLGNHTFAYYGEYKNSVSKSLGYSDVITSIHEWLPAGASRGNATRGIYRYYLGDAQGSNIEYMAPTNENLWGTYNLEWYNDRDKLWVKEPVTISSAFTGGGTQTRQVIKTRGGVMQNHLLNGRIVTTYGKRMDTNLTRTSNAAATAPDRIGVNLEPSRTWPRNWARREGKTEQKGAVVKPFREIGFLDRIANQGGIVGSVVDTLRSINVHYNESTSFTPSTPAQNLNLELLPDPYGEGKDYGFSLSLLDNKVFMRFNWYDTNQAKSRFGDSGTIATRAGRIDFAQLTGGSDRFNLYRNAREWTASEHPDWTEEQIEQDVAKQMGFPLGHLQQYNSISIADVSDVHSKGKEIELSFNPNRNWTGRITIGQQQTIDDKMATSIADYIARRMPLWESIVDPRTRAAGPDGLLNTADDTFAKWWTNKYGSTSALDFYNVSVIGPYKIAVANQGKPRSQVREWRYNVFSTLKLAMFTDNQYLKNISVTGAARYQDKASIGFYSMASDPSSYDPNRPIYDEARWDFDGGLSYQQRIMDNKVGMRLQLNVRNITESGRLNPVGALPNGEIHTYRVVDPRLFLFTATFDF